MVHFENNLRNPHFKSAVRTIKKVVRAPQIIFRVLQNQILRDNFCFDGKAHSF